MKSRRLFTRIPYQTLVAAPRDDFLKARPQKGRSVLTSEGVSPSVLTSDRRERADKLPQAAC